MTAIRRTFCIAPLFGKVMLFSFVAMSAFWHSLILAAATEQNQELAQTVSNSDWKTRATLFGTWGGSRSYLENKGVTFDLRHTSTYQGLVSGTGDDTFEYGGKVDAFIDLDGEKIGLWQGSEAHSHIEYSHGDAPAVLGGALFANNTALYWPVDTPKEWVATSLYLTQRIGERSGISVGKFNPVDVYAQHPFNGGWGIDRFMNVVFSAPPSGIIPVVFMGALVSVEIDPVTWTILVSDPNDRTNDYFPGDLFEDGVNVAVNATRVTTLAGRETTYGATALYSTADGVDYSSIGGGIVHTSTDSGAYNINVQFKHNLQESSDQADEAWGLYLKIAVADGNPNYVKSSIIAGVSGRALFLGRPQDSFGLGASYYNLSDELQDSLHPRTNFGDEAVAEVFYNYAVTPWLYVGPDIQYVKPARGGYKKALVAALRTQIRF